METIKSPNNQYILFFVMGIVAAAIDIPLVISLAILIYSGEMAEFASIGIGTFLFGGIIANLVIGRFSSVRGVISGPQDSPAAILALMVAAVAGGMATASPEERFATVFVLIALVSIITGIFFILAGKFKLSRLIRFIPYPVIGGFVAGTGLLLALGAFSVMTDISPTLQNLDRFFAPDIFSRWIFGAIFGTILVIATRRSSKVWLVPVMLTLAAAIFYGFTTLSGQSLADLQQAGLLLGPFEQSVTWRPLDLAMLAQVNWRLIFGQFSNLAAIILVSAVALLLNVSALELVINRDVQLDQELVASGIANIVGGLGGSPISYSYLSMSALPIRAGARSRENGLFAAMLYFVVLSFGAVILERIPKFMVGGLLFFLGVSFLLEWVYDAWKSLPRADYALVLVIVAIIGGVGFLEGVAAGVLIAVILFAVNYSRLEFVKNALDGGNYRSSVDRPVEHRRLIQQKGERIVILRLQGFLFFGTAQSLLDRIRERIRQSDLPDLEYLILDFQRVTALDSSAVISFVRLQQLTESHNIQLLFTDINADIENQLIQHDLLGDAHETTHIFASLDYGMEWCEDRILAADEELTLIFPTTLQGRLRQIFENDADVQQFMSYLVRQELEKEQVLIKQGTAPDAIYFVDKGELTARLETAPGEFMRLRSLGGGTVVGEVGVYLNYDRTATIIATKPSVVYRLGVDALAKMEKEAPKLTARLHFWNARQLSERLADNNRTIEALLD